MNIKEVRNISKSSADQRKGRCGRTSPGICFRLYSEQMYKELPIAKIPEIFRISLDQVVLKLKLLKVKRLSDFKFISQPSDDQFNQALDLLKMLGAIENETENITETGVLMTQFTTSPSISRMIIEGFNRGCLPEAILMGSIMENSRSFYANPREDEKANLERAKVNQFHESGDPFSIYQIYFTAVYFMKDQRLINNWCNGNYINPYAFKSISKGVDETWKAVRASMIGSRIKNVEVPKLLDKALVEKLTQCILVGFCQTLSKFTGNPYLGYVSMLSKTRIFLYGSSIFMSSQNYPNAWIVYFELKENFRKNAYMITSIPDALLDKALPPFAMEKLQIKEIRTNPPFASKEYNKIPTVALEELNQDPYNLFGLDLLYQQWEIDIQKGYLILWYESKLNQKGIFDLALQNLENTYKTASYEIPFMDDVRIIIDAYGEIQSMLFQDEYLIVAVTGFDRSVNKENFLKDHIGTLWLQNGKTKVKFHTGYREETKLILHFANPVIAKKFVSEKEKCPTFVGRGLSVSPDYQRTCVQTEKMKMEFEWYETKPTGEVWIYFSNSQEARQFIGVSRNLGWNTGEFARMTFSIVGAIQREGKEVILRGADTSLDDNDWLNRIKAAKKIYPYIYSEIPRVRIDREKPETRILLIGETQRKIQKLLRETKRKFGLEKLDETIELDISKQGLVKGTIVFNSTNSDLEKIPEELNGKSGLLGIGKFYLKIIYESSFNIHIHKWKLVEDKLSHTMRTIYATLESQKNDPIRLTEEKCGNKFRMEIKIISTSLKSVRLARKQIDVILQGEKLELSKQDLLRMKRHEVREQYWEIERKNYVKIEEINGLNIWTIFGPNTAQAKEELNKLLHSTGKNEWRFFDYSLIGKNLGVLFADRSSTFFDLQRKYFKYCDMDLQIGGTNKKIRIRSTLETFETVSRELDRILENKSKIIEDLECSICMDIIHDKYRMAECKHEVCRECLVLNFKQQLENFEKLSCPICKAKILYADVLNFFPMEQIAHFLKIQLELFLQMNSLLYGRCPTPGCGQIYSKKLVERNNQTIDCQSCGVITHLDPDWEIKELKRLGCKFCPFCRVPVLKNEGCNHITCRCGKHFCYKCGKGFQTASDTYAHMENGRCVLYDDPDLQRDINLVHQMENRERERARANRNQQRENNNRRF